MRKSILCVYYYFFLLLVALCSGSSIDSFALNIWSRTISPRYLANICFVLIGNVYLCILLLFPLLVALNIWSHTTASRYSAKICFVVTILVEVRRYYKVLWQFKVKMQFQVVPIIIDGNTKNSFTLNCNKKYRVLGSLPS